MRPFFALSFILASAMWAPTYTAGVVATHGVVPNTVGAAVTQSHGPAPLATHPLKAGPVVPHPVNYVAPPAPAPYTTTAQGPGVTTIHQQAPVVTKQVHYGTTDLKGTVAYNAPIVKEQIEVHNVQNPVLVERRVDVPYDVPVYKENIISVPTPVHVDAPYNVPVPVAVQGETIVKHTKAAPVVTHSQHHVNAGVVGVEHAGYAGYAGIPAAGLVH